MSLTEKSLAPRSPPVRRRETRTGGLPASRTTRTRSRSGPGRTGRRLRGCLTVVCRFQKGMNRREKALSGKSRVSHSVHCPYYTDDKQEFW